MKKNKAFLKIISLLFCIIFFSSCGSKEMLKTKDVTDRITQTKVILQSENNENEEFEEFFKEFSPSFTLPGLFEGVIPQGICYNALLDSYIISNYYEDEAFPSVITIVNAESGKFEKALFLQYDDGTDYTGHAGGIACSDEYIFISSDGQCYTISIEAIIKAENYDKLQFERNFKLNTKGSFATFCDDILWFGDFIESDNKARESSSLITTLDNGETFYAYCEGYILENGLPKFKSINSTQTGYIPDYYIAIPEQVQGMAFSKTGDIIFSTSYGRKNNSKLYIYEDILVSERVGTIDIDGNIIDLLACNNENNEKTITALPMSEGMTQSKYGVTLIFESGAEKYRQHRGKFPVDTAYIANIE